MRWGVEPFAMTRPATIDAVLDAGPIIAQAKVPVLADDTPATLSERVLEEEHRLLPTAIKWFVEGRLSIRDNRVLLDGAINPAQGLS